MITNWIKPLSKEVIRRLHNNSEYDFGERVLFSQGNDIPESTIFTLGIIGIDSIASNIIRKHLYKLSYKFENIRIIDFGNARKSNPEFLIQILDEFINLNICPILLGSNEKSVISLYQAYQNQKNLINLGIFENSFKLMFSKYNDFHEIISSKDSHLLSYKSFCYQTQKVTDNQLKLISDLEFENYSLGSIINSLNNIEPRLRDVDILGFNINSIASTFVPGAINCSPNGLTPLDACKLVRLSGVSNKLSSASFYGYSPLNDLNEQTAKLIAQIIWYLFDGLNDRTDDFPISSSNLVQKETDIKISGYKINFWVSKKSGRWWVEIPINEGETIKKYLIACLEEDYQTAKEGKLPNIISSNHKKLTTLYNKMKSNL